MNGLGAIALAMMMYGAVLWETEPITGIILFAVGFVLAIPVMISTWKREEHI